MSLLAEPPPPHLLSVSAPSPRRPPSTRHSLARSDLAFGPFHSLSPITSPSTSPKPSWLPGSDHPVWKAFPPAPKDDEDTNNDTNPVRRRPSHRIQSVSVGGDASLKRANSDPRRRSLPYPSPSPSPSNSSSTHPAPSSRLPLTDPETVHRPALFHLSGDDDSDDDDDDEEYADARSDEPTNGVHPGDDSLPKKRKVNSNASRYYALLELLQTEAHYLLDLRILVNVRAVL